ncbi:MAG: hypothetical protein QOH31_1528, partial [Verrucomicrobiota bacterium]
HNALGARGGVIHKLQLRLGLAGLRPKLAE